MDGFQFGSRVADSLWPNSTTNNVTQMKPPPKPQLQQPSRPHPTEPQDIDPSWTVDSADVVVRTGPNGMTRFQPWSQQIATPPKDDSAPSTANEETPGPNSQTLFPHPALSLPVPELKFDFRMNTMLTPVTRIGSSTAEIKNRVFFTGGTWSGNFGSGAVMPGGQSTMTIQHSSFVVEMKAEYLLQTRDEPPAAIAVRSEGVRTGSKEVLKELFDPEMAEAVDPRRYRFRVFVRMETADERYAEMLNSGMWVGSAVRSGAEIIYDAYRVQ